MPRSNTCRLVIIGDPLGRRCHQFLAQIDEMGGIDAEVVSWADVIQARGCLDNFEAFDRPGFVRIESTGENFELTRGLLSASSDDSQDWRTLAYRKGWLVHPRLVFDGFCRVMSGLEKSFQVRPHLRPLARPRDVIEMFDKNRTVTRLIENEVSTPEILPVMAGINGEELVTTIKRSGHAAVYAKLNTGASATGIAAIDTRQSELSAQTSMLRIGGDIYNTLQLQNIDEKQLVPLLDFLAAEGLCLQRGIHKARIDGMGFDIRVIVISGKPEFTIFRLSSAPMTNLHFGGRRGDVESCRHRIPTRAWLDAMDSCIEVAGLYDAQMVGIDLAFERGYFRHYIIEVNAFGDFFPGWKDTQGRSIYQVEIESLLSMSVQ